MDVHRRRARGAGRAGDPACLDPTRPRRQRRRPDQLYGQEGLRPDRPGVRAGRQRPFHHRDRPRPLHTLTATTLPTALKTSGANGYLAGTAASQLDSQNTITSRLPLIITVVVLTALILILVTFRSVPLAIKAALLNLLSIGAAYGVLVAVFQWGWGRSLTGLTENVPIRSYVPMMMFAVVFGLSMDYEIFLLSRIQEAGHATGDATGSVATGLASTARVITGAALIQE